jgi:hypothetical protein
MGEMLARFGKDTGKMRRDGGSKCRQLRQEMAGMAKIW